MGLPPVNPPPQASSCSTDACFGTISPLPLRLPLHWNKGRARKGNWRGKRNGAKGEEVKEAGERGEVARRGGRPETAVNGEQRYGAAGEHIKNAELIGEYERLLSSVSHQKQEALGRCGSGGLTLIRSGSPALTKSSTSS